MSAMIVIAAFFKRQCKRACEFSMMVLVRFSIISVLTVSCAGCGNSYRALDGTPSTGLEQAYEQCHAMMSSPDRGYASYTPSGNESFDQGQASGALIGNIIADNIYFRDCMKAMGWQKLYFGL